MVKKRSLPGGLWLSFALFLAPGAGALAAEGRPQSVPLTSPIVPNLTALEYIDSNFENASPVWYELASDGTILIHLLYDHERSSPNRASGHVHFQIHARPGAKLKLEITNLENVWNSMRTPVARQFQAMCISENGRDWTTIPVDNSSGTSARFEVVMPGPRLYVARIEPYRLSDLEKFLAEIRPNPLVEITPIGTTVQGRELEIVRIGREDAPNRVFLRARAHPWEPGGNWVVEGLITRLLRGDAEAQQFLERTCYYVLPMANKDGVVLGRTRFNMLGKDLNRDWDKPVDQELAPENYALDQWLKAMIARGKKPHFAMELHNDANGRLHVAHPPVPHLDRHLQRMDVFEKLLRQHTWFSEGRNTPARRNTGTLGSGWLVAHEIDAVVHEFNVNVIAGLPEKPMPQGKHWMEYGEKLATVFHEYFAAINP